MINKIKNLIVDNVDDFVITKTESTSNQNKFANNNVVVNKNWNQESYDLFISIRDKDGFKVGNTDININLDIEKQIKNLIRFTNNTPVNTNYLKIYDENKKYRDLKSLYDSNVKNLDSSKILRDVIDLSIQKGADRVGGVLEHGWGKVNKLTSSGFEGQYEFSNINLSTRVMKEDASSHKVKISNSVKNFTYRPIILSAVEEAKNAIFPEKIKSGKYDCIFYPMSFANLVNEIGRSSSYDNVIGGFSFLNNKLNKNVSSDIFSLYDVGNLNGGHASAPFDYEGRPSKPTEIIGSGIMKNYLTNTSQSIKYNLPATSNSSILNVSPTNLVVPIGKKSNEKLIQKMDEGLIITNSWYHRYQNYMTGDFSLLPRDAIFKVKEGKIIGSVKDVRISGNMIDVMKNIDDMSNKKESILNWESSIPSDVPAALIKNLNFTSI
tara:strand:- start:838 stop:2145 length:1308 start_codon:yes stop_codon:yes gene_type:complete